MDIFRVERTLLSLPKDTWAIKICCSNFCGLDFIFTNYFSCFWMVVISFICLFLKPEFIGIYPKLKSWVFWEINSGISNYHVEVTSEQPYFNSVISLDSIKLLIMHNLWT
jgi:hypothetical protein